MRVAAVLPQKYVVVASLAHLREWRAAGGLAAVGAPLTTTVQDWDGPFATLKAPDCPCSLHISKVRAAC